MRNKVIPLQQEIHSLQVVVPSGCINKCRFCCVDLHGNRNTLDPFHSLDTEAAQQLEKSYLHYFNYVRANGGNSLVITSTGEAVLKMDYISRLGKIISQMENPFPSVELQTSGLTLDREKVARLVNEGHISTISLSLSSMWNKVQNADYNLTPVGREVDMDALCNIIKEFPVTLRLTALLTDVYNGHDPKAILGRAKQLGADQVTFKQLQLFDEGVASEKSKVVADWIVNHRTDQRTITDLREHIKSIGTDQLNLGFGIRYMVDGMSVVLDDACMDTNSSKNDVRYLILRPDGRLYPGWEVLEPLDVP